MRYSELFAFGSDEASRRLSHGALHERVVVDRARRARAVGRPAAALAALARGGRVSRAPGAAPSSPDRPSPTC